MPREKMMQEDRLKWWWLCHLEICWSLKKGTVGSAKMKTQEGNWDDVVTAGTGCLSWQEPQSPSDLPASFYSGWRTGVRKENVHFQTAGQVSRKAQSQSAFTLWEAYPQSTLEELASQAAQVPDVAVSWCDGNGTELGAEIQVWIQDLPVALGKALGYNSEQNRSKCLLSFKRE